MTMLSVRTTWRRNAMNIECGTDNDVTARHVCHVFIRIKKSIF